MGFNSKGHALSGPATPTLTSDARDLTLTPPFLQIGTSRDSTPKAQGEITTVATTSGPEAMSGPSGKPRKSPSATGSPGVGQHPGVKAPAVPQNGGLAASISGLIANSLRNLANTLSPETSTIPPSHNNLSLPEKKHRVSSSTMSPVARKALEQPADISLPSRGDTTQAKRTGTSETSSGNVTLLPANFSLSTVFGRNAKDSPGGTMTGFYSSGIRQLEGETRNLSLDQAAAQGGIFEDTTSSPVMRPGELRPITPKSSFAARPASRNSSILLHEAVSSPVSRRTTATPSDLRTTPRASLDGSKLVADTDRAGEEAEDNDVQLDPISRAISTRATSGLFDGTPPGTPISGHMRYLRTNSFPTATNRLSGPVHSTVAKNSSTRYSNSTASTPTIKSTDLHPSANSGLPKPKKNLLSRLGLSQKKSPAHKRAISAASQTSSPSSTASRPETHTPAMPHSSSVASSWGEQDAPTWSGEAAVARPRFVRVRIKNKANKELKHLFLAQELMLAKSTHKDTDVSSVASSDENAPLDDHAHRTGPKHGRKQKAAVWAMSFSKDGQYLAAAGQDCVVRVWHVEGRYSSHLEKPNATDTAQDSPNGTPPSTLMSAATGHTSQAGTEFASKKRAKAAEVPVFAPQPVLELIGHTADVLSLSWSKNNFLLSSSMDKTVRLWHISRKDCLSAFLHLDVAVAVEFHPQDDRFFLSGSLDCKLRLWNVPEKRVHAWTELPELITAVGFTNEGKLACAGSFMGRCTFFDIESFRYATQIISRSGRTKKGKKVTAICPLPGTESGQDKILITTNDSRMRLFTLVDRACVAKYRGGHANETSMIKASFSEDGRYIITGSEDRGVYIYESGLQEGGSYVGWLRGTQDRGGYETFTAESDIATCCIFAPEATHRVLARSGDLIFDRAKTLSPQASRVSRTSTASSRSESAAVKSSGLEGAIIVCADDHTGVIRVYRNSPFPPDHPALSAGSRRSSQAPVRSRAGSIISGAGSASHDEHA